MLSIRLAALIVLTVLPGVSLAQPRTAEATTVRPHVQTKPATVRPHAQTKPATHRRPDDPEGWSPIYYPTGQRVGVMSPMRR